MAKDDRFGGTALAGAADLATALLEARRADLNRLNVYPVPDGDTGDNMAATIRAAAAAVDLAADASLTGVAAAMAEGALMGGRGNSGVILSQLLRGFASALEGRSEIDGDALSAALRSAADAGRHAVAEPQEGTILSVADAAAEAATGSAAPSVRAVAERAYDAAVAALRRTTEQLPVLSSAGVVDAGGAGYLLVLAGLVGATGGNALLPDDVFAETPLGIDELKGVATSRYEVMHLLASDEPAADRLRATWATLGDSVVVVGGDGTFNCHAHTDDIGAVIEAAIAAGRPYDIRVTDLWAAAAHADFHGPAGFEALPEFATAATGVVAVGSGDGLAELFRSLGAQGLVRGGQSMNPSVAEIVDVVDAVGADTVIFLPNNENIVLTGEQAARATAKALLVVPTRSIPQGLSAMVAFPPASDDPSAIVERMTAAAGAVRSGRLVRAIRSADTPIGSVGEGDWLGLQDGEVALAAASPGAALLELVEGLVDVDSELVTLIEGEGADEISTRAVTSWLRAHRPYVEVEVVRGGQPVYPYLISVE
jgi:DAK2 domain fusion protein YloV